MLAAYAGASMFFSPIAGVLADTMSTRQAPFLLGLSTLLAATVLLFLGRSVEVLLAARILQGISGAVVWSVGMAMCIETVGLDNLGKSIGTVWLLFATCLFQTDFGLDVLLHFSWDYLGCTYIVGKAWSDYGVTMCSHTQFESTFLPLPFNMSKKFADRSTLRF